MKRRMLLGLAALAVGPAPAAPARLGDAVAWPTTKLLDGSSWSAEQARGQAVVVVFWTLDCAYCERHLAHVEKLHRVAQGKPLFILAALRGGSAAAARNRLQERGWTFAVTLDAEPLSAVLSQRRSVPLTVTVDREGRLREQIPGEMFEDDVIGLLKLAVQPVSS